MKTLTEYLNEVKQRESEATGGEWVVNENCGVVRKDREYCVETNHGSCKSFALYIARAEHAHSFATGSDADKNMNFIANAKQDIPLLLEIIEKLKTQRDDYAFIANKENRELMKADLDMDEKELLSIINKGAKS